MYLRKYATDIGTKVNDSVIFDGEATIILTFVLSAVTGIASFIGMLFFGLLNMIVPVWIFSSIASIMALILVLVLCTALISVAIGSAVANGDIDISREIFTIDLEKLDEVEKKIVRLVK